MKPWHDGLDGLERVSGSHERLDLRRHTESGGVLRKVERLFTELIGCEVKPAVTPCNIDDGPIALERFECFSGPERPNPSEYYVCI